MFREQPVDRASTDCAEQAEDDTALDQAAKCVFGEFETAGELRGANVTKAAGQHPKAFAFDGDGAKVTAVAAGGDSGLFG